MQKEHFPATEKQTRKRPDINSINTSYTPDASTTQKNIIAKHPHIRRLAFAIPGRIYTYDPYTAWKRRRYGEDTASRNLVSGLS